MLRKPFKYVTVSDYSLIVTGIDKTCVELRRDVYNDEFSIRDRSDTNSHHHRHHMCLFNTNFVVVTGGQYSDSANTEEIYDIRAD